MPKKSEYLTQSNYAKRVGRTRQAISLAVKSGLLPTRKIKGKKLINPVDPACQEYEKNAKSVREDEQELLKKDNFVEDKSKKKNRKRKIV